MAIWVPLCDNVRGDIGAWRKVGKREKRGRVMGPRRVEGGELDRLGVGSHE